MYPPITSCKFPDFFVFYLDFATEEVRKRFLITKFFGTQKLFRGQHATRERRVERALIYDNIREITGRNCIVSSVRKAGLQNGTPAETSHICKKVDKLHAEKKTSKYRYRITGLDSPFQEFLESRYMKVLKLSALSTGRLHLQKTSLVLISVTG